MSDSEEESFSFYGKPLEQYDEDSMPKRKPIAVEDQIATDSHGRRRFHGAFTGGFSAGFFNTVGSLEGWKPTEFKSSRLEKAEKKITKPEDFMDDEDMGEHGIAPQLVRATKDYATGGKRKKPVFSEGPIPGIPVLHSLIEAGNETIGYLLMKNMDLRTRSKEMSNVSEEGEKVYGCEMPKTYEIQRNIEKEDIIPQIFQDCIKNPKDNTFGLGYVGLDKSELSVKRSTQLVVRDQNNRKLAISGQAFGVGAFENDDEDIYAKDDMSQYDFEMSKEKSGKIEKRNFSHPEFVKGTERLMNNHHYPSPTIPHSFSGKHKVRKSRFEPIPTEETAKKVEIKRKDMNAAIRAQYIGEEVPSTSNELTKATTAVGDEFKQPAPLTKVKQENVVTSGLILDKFVSATITENPHDILERVEPTYIEHGTKEMRDAAKLKMFGPLTRNVIDWQPCSLVCKRFNVREPIYDVDKKDKRKKSQIFFEYEKHKEEGINFKPGLLSTKEESDVEGMQPEKIDVAPIPSIIEETTTLTEIKEKQVEIKEIHTKITDDVNEIKDETNNDFIDITEEIPKVIQQTDKIDVAKNIDLFKAVFLSSSESESEDEVEQQPKEDNREAIIKKSVLIEDLITNIKPRKEGILSNIDFNPLTPKPAEIVKETIPLEVIEEPEEMKRDPFLYGPELPNHIEKLPISYKVPQMVVDEEWVEKDSKGEKGKHKKKHKKEKRSKDKKRHKRSKHRH